MLKSCIFGVFSLFFPYFAICYVFLFQFAKGPLYGRLFWHSLQGPLERFFGFLWFFYTYIHPAYHIPGLVKLGELFRSDLELVQGFLVLPPLEIYNAQIIMRYRVVILQAYGFFQVFFRYVGLFLVQIRASYITISNGIILVYVDRFAVLLYGVLYLALFVIGVSKVKVQPGVLGMIFKRTVKKGYLVFPVQVPYDSGPGIDRKHHGDNDQKSDL